MGLRGPIAKKKAAAFTYAAGMPPPPSWLDRAAVAEYNRAAEIMGGQLTLADMSVLAAYAQAYADFARFTVAARKEGEVLKLSNGVLASNPKCTLRDAAFKRMQAAASKIGFSPVDRARGPAGPGAPAADAFSEFVK
jgi:P27 family predicted phage terminase small subunit